MQYVYQFAMAHPFIFLLIVGCLSSWRPIQVYKQYGKEPDEIYVVDAKDGRSR